jgi:serine/threonine protein kinase
MQDNLLPFRAEGGRHSLLVDLCGSTQFFRDRYQIGKTLGKGGFGITFLARDHGLPGKPLCVIKQLCPKISDPVAFDRALERFEREARILGQLGGHSSIPSLMDYFELDAEFFLVQEYIRGGTLSKEVKVSGVWDEAKTRQFLREILAILTYVHGEQVIHRDIKPPNLMRCQDTGRLVLLDFGAVKEGMSDAELNHDVATTHFVGTMGFAPPEQLALRATYSTDIYAVGVTCLFLMTGKPPNQLGCDARTGELLWQSHASVSPSFERILNRMTKISLQDRYGSTAQVLRALSIEEAGEDLQGYLHRQSRPMELELGDGYNSPAARMAASIRGWRGKQKKIPSRSTGSGLVIGNFNGNFNRQPDLMYSR